MHDLAERRLSPIERSTNQFDVGGRHALCFSTRKLAILLQKPTTNSRCGTVKPGVQLRPYACRITVMFAKALIFAAIGLIHAAMPSRLLPRRPAPRPTSAPSASPPRRNSTACSTTKRGPATRSRSTRGCRTTRCAARPPRKRRTSGLGYDDEALYFAFRCLDTQPDKIRTTISRRDNAFSDDWVGVSLDSSRAGQLAYHLFVNPSGIQMDALQSGSDGEDFAPDWVWQSAGHVGADGWSAEIRVPLENIRFRSGADVRMGVLFWRRLSRTGVSSSWPEMPPGKWVFESNAPVVVRRAAVAAPARGDSERDVLAQPGRVRIGSSVERHAGARRLRRQREIRHDVGGHARRDRQPRFQPGRKRRVRGRGQPAFSGLLQREAAVLHGRAGPVQSRRHRRRFDDADGGAHADDRRSQRRREADRRRGQAYVRRAVVGRRVSRQASGSAYSRSRAK